MRANIDQALHMTLNILQEVDGAEVSAYRAYL